MQPLNNSGQLFLFLDFLELSKIVVIIKVSLLINVSINDEDVLTSI